VGSAITKLKKGDRVVIPFTISCGSCFFCKKELYSVCDTTNPNAALAREAMGHAPAGLFGFSHMMGGYAGGQAEYLRVPHADVGALKIESDLPDEKVLFLSDIFPTGYMAAENCGIEPGDTVAVWGCGPVGQFAIKSAWLLGAQRVIAIDRCRRRRKAADPTAASTLSAARRTARAASMRCWTRPRPPSSSPPIARTSCARPFSAVVRPAPSPFPVRTSVYPTRSRSAPS
jgi:threonine dehydrogenase-like Zn-dependent dehydrogenase